MEQREGRQTPRQRVLKGAQLLFGDSAVDCIVRDVSATGARVKVSTPFHCPEVVILQFKDGERHWAERRWVRGQEIGLRYTDLRRLTEEGRARNARAAGEQASPAHAFAVYQEVLRASPQTPLRLLHLLRFFDDATLRDAAQDLEAAYGRLEAELVRHVEAELRRQEAAPAAE